MKRLLIRNAIGAASILALCAFVEPAHAFRVPYAFQGGNDGAYPASGLIRYAGNFYGTTSDGGTGTCSSGCGTVFELGPNGSKTVLYSFQGADGYLPVGSLSVDKYGSLYGVTEEGGTYFYGNVFKLAPNGTERVLYSFAGGNDGINPHDGLVMDAAGDLYGTTYFGGGSGCYGNGCGIVFEIEPDGTETVLYRFKGGADGANPAARLVRDGKGNLYGTTENGGANNGLCCGTVFKVFPDGKEKVLHAFGTSEGTFPVGSLIRDHVGNLYGTTSEGGNCVSYCAGAVFELAPDGTESTLYTFTCEYDVLESCNGGATPLSGLIRDVDGDLYGTAPFGGGQIICGKQGCGTVFKIAPDGTETTLHAFCTASGCPDGSGPSGSLIVDKTGRLFGTASGGGVTSCDGGAACGVVFELKE